MELFMNILIPILVVIGLWLMSRVPTAVRGNRTSILAMSLAIVVALWGTNLVSILVVLLFALVGAGIGLFLSRKVTMIQMPQTVGLLNGLGGGASALVGIVTLMGVMDPAILQQRAAVAFIDSLFNNSEITLLTTFEASTAVLAIIIGMMTLMGSLVAAGKLHRVLSQKPVILKNHSFFLGVLLVLTLGLFVWGGWFLNSNNLVWVILLTVIIAGAFGWIFTIRVGGADMPITISLLNSLSGVAGSIAGMAIGNIMLVAIGGIVGASGLLLTQIMCNAMNRSLIDILLGKTSSATNKAKTETKVTVKSNHQDKSEAKGLDEILKDAKSVIIVPGYGMALAQAQHQVKQLGDAFEKNGTKVRYAIHPVAGRMPGHMNVLLAEADVDYEELIEMEQINDDFKDTDLVVVVGANDVLNPAARDAEGTPIYGMPVLNVDHAKHVIICNFDLNPGYAGVPNPLYEDKEKVTMMLGDAKESVNKLLSELQSSGSSASQKASSTGMLKDAKSVIIVPGYGMALAQAQHQVKQLGDAFEKNGAKVRYAIHPVAGRMPGHMNVLLAEADVDYEELIEMEQINDDFKDTDLVVVVGANDVLNPAARDAEGTPIYGMPVLNVDHAKHVIICNFDLNPGYAGVPNPLYEDKEKVTMMLGDAKESVNKLLSELQSSGSSASQKASSTGMLKDAKSVIIVPGYGMALAQAQHQVKQLGDAFEKNGAKVRYAIHPVAGRMPGHMNVLLAEADVDYEELIEMEQINDDFKNTDLVVVIGANDVLNPAARDAEGTPIYGMPVLNVDHAKHVIICNFDLNPGYAGVPNPLYEDKEKVTMMLGDAKESVNKLLSELQ